MRKRAGFDFPGLYGAVLTDIAVEYPYDAMDWNRDLARLQSIADQDGHGFFTLTLPAMGKHLDRCLSTGVLLPSRLPHHRGYRQGGAIPRLFRVLYLRIFDDNGILRPSPDVTAIRFLRQLLYIAKKARLSCHETANYKAVQSFWAVESATRLPTLDWAGDILPDPAGRLHLGDGCAEFGSEWGPGGGSSPQLDLLDDPPLAQEDSHVRTVNRDTLMVVLDTVQRVADSVLFNLKRFEPLDHRPKHGPGAVADLRMGADKYRFPNWPAKLEGVFGIADFAYANYALYLDAAGGGDLCVHSAHEPPAKLHAVPKTLKGPRLIAAEPTSHQWCQQVVKDYLYDSVRSSVLGPVIDFRRQDLSQEAALRASHTGLFATVDLSDASDRLSCWCIERLFRSRKDLLDAFHAVRTRWLVQTIDKKVPRHIVLRKFSTMGSALTFPVQSIAFAIVAIGVRLYMSNQRVDSASVKRARDEVRVFGDDIICRSEDVGVLTEVLTYLGLKVNVDKTFSEGFFRESCGLDAYGGIEVTPSYVLEVSNETQPSAVASIVDTSNNFHYEGYWRTAEWIVSTIPDRLFRKLAVLPFGTGGLSLSSFCGRHVDHLDKRYNHELHVEEFRHLSVVSTAPVCQRDSLASYLQYFAERPEADDFGIQPEHPLGFMGRPKNRMKLRWGPLAA